METTTDTKSTMALFEILSYKNIIFQYAVLIEHCSLFGPHECSASIDEGQWVPFLPHGGIQ